MAVKQMKTIESLEKQIEALKVLLEMSEAHKSAMIAMHQAEKEMILYTKINFENGELRKGEHVVELGGNKQNKLLAINIDKNGKIVRTRG